MAKNNDSLFKTFKLKWWQASLFKTAAVSFGILLGVFFTDFLSQYTTLLWITFLIPGLYIAVVYFKQ